MERAIFSLLIFENRRNAQQRVSPENKIV